jgi:hypothetical protein
MDNMREEALQGLVSDSIDKFIPCDILKDEFKKLKEEITELRTKAVEEGRLTLVASTANDNLADVSGLSSTASAQAQRLEELLKVASELGVKMDTAEKIVAAEKAKKPQEKLVQVDVPAKKAAGENAGPFSPGFWKKPGQ